MQAMAYYPGIVESVLAIYDRIQADEGRMSDLLAGFLDPDPEDVAPTEAASTEDVNDQDFDDADTDDDDSGDTDDEAEEGDTGPDPEEVRARFEALRTNLAKASKVITKKGRDAKEAKEAIPSEIKSEKSSGSAPSKGSWIVRSSLKNGTAMRPTSSGSQVSRKRRNWRNSTLSFPTCNGAKLDFSPSRKALV